MKEGESRSFMNLLLEESGAADSSSRYRLDTPWKGVRTAEKTITEKYHFQ